MALDFTFTPEQEAVRDVVRRFCREEIAPLVRTAEETETFPRHLFPRMAELGLLGARYPAADGGGGMDKVTDCIIREEMSFVSQGISSSWSAHTQLAIWPIWKAGTDEQKHRFFRPALAGSKIGAFALSEPEGGSNVRGLRTRARKVPGGWRLDGSKLYITNAPLADFLLLAARTEAEIRPQSISLFIVELPNPGIRISKLAKEGIRCSETGLVYIADAFVADDCLLGERQGTYPIILETLSENRVGVSANALGMARAAFEASLAYAGERQVAGKRIGDYQAIGHRLADMAAAIEAARLMVYYGAWRIDQGALDPALAAKIKLTATEIALRVSEQAIRIHGGAGIMREYDVGRIHRDALVYVIGEGTAEIQRNIIARGLGFRS